MKPTAAVVLAFAAMVAVACNDGAVPSALVQEVDQQQSVIDASVGGLAIGGASEQQLAQVVTAGISAILSKIRLPVACSSGDLVMEIQEVTDNVPNGTVLTSQTVTGASLPSFPPNGVAFRSLVLSAPVTLSAGSRFAIVLHSAGECGLFQGPTGNPYPGGDGFFDSRPNPVGIWVLLGTRADLPFETLVR